MITLDFTTQLMTFCHYCRRFGAESRQKNLKELTLRISLLSEKLALEVIKNEQIIDLREKGVQITHKRYTKSGLRVI